MPCPHCVDSVGIRILGLRNSWWHSRQANDAVASERSNFSKNHDDKMFSVSRPVNTYVHTYVPIFCGVDACGG